MYGDILKKTIKISDKTFSRIKSSLPDELASLVKRISGEFDSIFEYLDRKQKEYDSEDFFDDEDGFIADSLKVYCIIRIVTFLETFLRTSFIILIDQYDKNFDLNVEISLQHLKQLRKDSAITNGQIMADSLNFQKFESNDKEYDIYKIFSNVLGIQIFPLMIKKEPRIPEIHQSIVKLLEERHSIVHDLKYSLWKNEDIDNSLTAVFDFVVILNEVAKEHRS